MTHRDGFLSEFDPLPGGAALPARVLADYEVDSCLAYQSAERLILLLRRKSDDKLIVLKAATAGKEDLKGEFHILTKLAPLLPGKVPEPIGCFEEAGTGYLLRTYLPGETLAQWREREGHCPEALCISLGQELCSLLEVLHSQKPPVIHRDIKPEHIILLSSGGVGLIDFGIARQFQDGKDTDTRHMGTRTTAAPEQYGYAQTDQRTDLYALGRTLTWLLTEQYDLEGLRRLEGVSPELRAVLEKSVSFSPEARFQNAASFSAALSGRSACRRRQRPLWAAALAVIVAAAVGIGLSWPGNVPSPQPPEQGNQVSPAPLAVTFTSDTMERAVLQALGQMDGEITYDQLSQIRRLAAVGENTFSEEQAFDYRSGCYIANQFQGDLPPGDVTDSDLELLAHMPNLRELYLCRQEIQDISVLEGLPLTTLALCEDKILDFSPLASLGGLETLYLGGNPGTDYSALSGLDRLTTLAVGGSASVGIGVVDSLDFLDGLSLRNLALGLTVPKDGSWEPLTRQIALEELLLWDPGEDAVAAAGTLTGLKTLSIGDYYVSDLTALSGLVGLEVLNIHKGSVESLAGIESLSRLITLSVGYNGVDDLTPLAGLTQLNYLQLEGLDIADFSVLANLPSLGYVVVPQEQGALVEAACPDHAFELRTF